MSTVGQTLHAYGDLFCELYDGLDEAEFRANIEHWSDPFLESAANGVAQEVRHGAKIAELRERLRQPGEEGRHRLALLMGLDRAFAPINPALRGSEPMPPAIAALAAEAIARGRLDSGAHKGALLLRHVTPPSGSNLPEHPRDMFAAVIRVPEESWQRCRHVVLGPATMLWKRELEPALKVACLPFIADPDEMTFITETRSSGRYYRIAPRSGAATRQRVRDALAALDASDAKIAVLPELMLSEELLAEWQAALRSPERAASPLRWVLVGSGDLGSPEHVSNIAVLLDGRTGEVIAQQEKMFRFHMSPTVLKRWGLTGLLGAEAIDEDIVCGEILTVLEAGTMRVGILICEDLGRVTDLAPRVRDLGISLLLVPVFSRPLRERRWEQRAAEVHSQATGTTSVISNSLIMKTIIGSGAGTAMMLAPGTLEVVVSASNSAVEPCCFLITPEGTATPG